tara:strand:+ start:1153 stop:6243 length:5091 start_codon:yes stop_codon:yes gene_type:complete
MARFRSGRVPHQHIGITSFTDNKLVLDVIGNANISNDLTVGGQLNAPSIIVSGTAPAQFDDVTARNLEISGIATFLGNVSIGGTLTYEDVTNIDSLGIVTARTGIDILSGTLGAGNTTGTEGQYLKSVGYGVTWSDFPQLRTSTTFVMSAGQSLINHSYNSVFVDLFYNGVKLLRNQEFTAQNGTQIVLISPAFEGDIVEVVSYNTINTTGGGGGGDGGARVSVGDTAPNNAASGDLWWKSNEGQLKIYYSDDDSSQWVDAAAGGGGGGSVSYTLTPATTTVLGGIKVGTGLTITTTGILSATATGNGNGNGSSTLEGLNDTSITSPQNGQVLKYLTGTGWINDSSSGGLSDIISDTTPQLGGDLDINGKKIVTTSNSHILLQPNGTGKVGIGNITVPYSLFHIKGSTPGITLQRSADSESSFIAFRTVSGTVGGNIVHESNVNDITFASLDNSNILQERIRLSSTGIRLAGITTVNGNVDINGNLDVSGSLNGVSYITSGSYGSTKTIDVKVVTKTSAHRYFGTGSAKGYTLDGLESPFLTLIPGITYRFDQGDTSNETHQLRFYLDSGRTTEYTTGVSFNGNAGTAGAYTEIEVSDSTPIGLHYQCVNHPLMGNSTQSNANGINTPYDAVLGGKLQVADNATFEGIVDVNNIMKATTVVSENIIQNSVVYAGLGGQLRGDNHLLYDENSFKVSGKNFQVTGAHSSLDTVVVSGIATFAGITTFTSENVYVDESLYVKKELWVTGVKITGGDEGADPPSYGADIVTRNLKTTGIVTAVGPVNYESNVTFDSTYDAIWDKNASKLMFMDGARATFGDSDDLEIIHTANKNIIHSVGAGTTIESQINTNTIHEINQSGIVVSGVATATKFSGDGSGLTLLPTLNTLSDVTAPTPSDGQVLKWNNTVGKWQAQADATGGGGGGGSETVIVPVAYAKVNTASAGTGTNMTWGAYNSSNGEMLFTFVGAQSDANYYVLAEREQYDTHSVNISNKTTTGFKATWLGNDGQNPLSPATFGGVLLVYASTPTKNVGAALEDVSVTVESPGTNNLQYNSTTGALTFTPYLLPTATANDLGGVKVDGTTITISNGVITASAAAPSVSALTDTTISAVNDGDILKWNGAKWVNDPLSNSTGVPRYSAVSNFPAATANQGQLAFSDNNKSLYLSDGTDWTGQRVVTTDFQSSDFASILDNFEKTYTLSATSYSGGTSSYNSARKRIKLSDSETTPNVSEFILHAGTGLSISNTTNAQSETEIGISVNSASFSMTAEDSGGASNSILRLTDNLASSNANTDITFAGAGGLVISRTDANTLLFTQADASGGDYSDTEAKAAAGAALAQGTHASINGGTVAFAYNSVNKTIGMTLTGATSNQNTTYDLLGRNTTTNEAYIDLKDSNNVTDSIHFQGSNGTTISWDDTYKRITIDSATVTTPDWNVNGGTSANPTGTAGGILNKPTLSDVGQTGKLSDSTDLKNTSANDGDRLKYVSSTQKWTPTTNNLADLSNVSNATPADGQVLKWDDTNSIWKPDTDESGTTGSTAFKGLSDTPNDYTSYAGKFLKVNSAENGLEFTDAAGASTIEEVNNTSSSIANNAYAELDITGQTVYTLFKIKASVASWVRLYVDDASRNLDATRSEGEDPLPGSGVVAEVRTTGVNQEVLITPGVMGFNNDSPTRTKKIYVAINNRSGSATTVTVTLTILKLG